MQWIHTYIIFGIITLFTSFTVWLRFRGIFSYIIIIMIYVYVNKIVIFYLPHPGICNILNGGPRINAPFSYACNLFNKLKLLNLFQAWTIIAARTVVLQWICCDCLYLQKWTSRWTLQNTFALHFLKIHQYAILDYLGNWLNIRVLRS